MTLVTKVARKLVFYTHPYDLTRDTTLLLSFMPPKSERLYIDMFPVAWRVLRISGGHGTTSVADYSNRLAFGVSQVNHGKITVPETFVEIGLGQKTTITSNNNGFIHWSLPTGGSDHADAAMKAVNDTGEIKDICIGSLDTHKPGFLPIICWPNVNNGGTAAVQFNPHLHVYACSDYQQNDLIRGEVENFLDSYNLLQLQQWPAENRFHLFEDKRDGQRLRLVKK